MSYLINKPYSVVILFSIKRKFSGSALDPALDPCVFALSQLWILIWKCWACSHCICVSLFSERSWIQEITATVPLPRWLSLGMFGEVLDESSLKVVCVWKRMGDLRNPFRHQIKVGIGDALESVSYGVIVSILYAKFCLQEILCARVCVGCLWF